MARVTRRIAALAAALLAATLLVACGGSSTNDKNAYARKVNAAQTKFADTVATVDDQSRSAQSIALQRRTLRRFKGAIDRVVADLRAIDPPSDVTTQHGRLVAVMAGFDRSVGQAVAALGDPTPEGIDLAKRRLQAVIQTVNARVAAALAAINVKLKGT